MVSCDKCDFTAKSTSELTVHTAESHADSQIVNVLNVSASSNTDKDCEQCTILKTEIDKLKAKEEVIEDLTERFNVAKQMYTEKVREMEKLKEEYKKETEHSSIEKMKVEDTLRNLVKENEKLKRKDDTYVNVFECLNQFLASKGFEISKLGDVQDEKRNVPSQHEGTFVCDICDFETEDRSILTEHNNDVHKSQFKCTKCSLSSSSEQEVVNHDVKEHSNPQLSCQSCDYTSKSADDLKNHIENVHDSIDVVVEENVQNVTVYKCNMCEFSSQVKQMVKGHMSEKHKNKVVLGSFKCDDCNYIGVRKESLEQHRKIKHVEEAKSENIFYCDLCKYETKIEDNMQRHQQDVHHRKMDGRSTDTMPCELCTFIGKTDDALKNHLENVHRFSEPNRRKTGFSNEQRLANGMCVFWQSGNCKFNELCKFAHEEIRRCRFDGHCKTFNCKDFHSQDRKTTSTPPFLYNGSSRFRNIPFAQHRQRAGNPFLRR